MNKPKTTPVLVAVLLVGTVFLGVRYFSVAKELRQTRSALQTQTVNEKVLEFTKFFIGEVLRADGEIDFDTRLKLEIAVGNLDDGEILSQWKRFVGSETEAEAQEEVKNLLELLVGKVKVR
ncbi:hypothetical protein JW899_00735 [Candidatus Uhrbacteria bacterium]|nr:hypothetical protein [Candidatus Uhrbacteria bacterium]